MQISDIKKAEQTKYDTPIITIPPTTGLRDCCFLPQMKFPRQLNPPTNEAKRKLAVNISSSDCHENGLASGGDS